MKTSVASATREVFIGDGAPTVIIGERINPAGKKSLAEALRSGNMDVVCKEAVDQVAAGADIVDVNVSLFGIDEVQLLPKVVELVSQAVDVPLCIDSSNPDALAAALKVATGRPLINSVTGEERSLSRVLPLVKERGLAVVGLLQDETGPSHDADKRLAIARRIVDRSEKMGIQRDSIVIDPLAFAVGADATAARVTIETIRRVSQELGVNVTLGASNISFGMPDRHVINNAFIALAIAAGATCLIADAARIRPTVLAVDLLLERDRHARRYMAEFRKRQGRT